MNIHDLIFAGVILLAVTAVCVAVFKRLGLGSVLGFLAAGLVVGPSGLEITAASEELRGIAELGVVLLLFIIGLELHPKKLWAMRRDVLGLGTLQVVVTAVALSGLLALLPPHSWRVDLMVALGLSLSSTAFVLQLLSESGDLAKPHGQATFSILLLQDVAVVPLLAVFPLLAGVTDQMSDEKSWTDALIALALVAALIVLGRWVLPSIIGRMARQRNADAFNLFTFLAVIGAAWMMEVAGLSLALGSFIMGLLLSDSAYRHQIEAVVEPYKAALLGLFFLSVGISIDVALFRSSILELLGLVAGVILIKWGVLVLLSRAFGNDWVMSLRVGFLLAQAGEFGFVLFGYSVSIGGLDPVLFNKLVLVISISMVLTPVLQKLSRAFTGRVERRPPVPDTPEVYTEGLERHVMVGGFGRVGETVCRLLQDLEIPYIAFDIDAAPVEEGRRHGFSVYYGDISKSETLRAAGCGRAALLVVTVSDAAAAARAVDAGTSYNPALVVHARATDLRQAARLLELGARHVEPDVVESSLRLGGEALLALGTPSDEIDQLIDSYRKDEYARLRA